MLQSANYGTEVSGGVLGTAGKTRNEERANLT